MKIYPVQNIVMAVGLLFCMNVLGVGQVWDGGGADQEWTTAANWGGDNPDMVPGSGDSATIDDGGTAIFSADSGSESVLRTQVNGGSMLEISGGSLSSSQTGKETRNHVGNGSAGTVNQSGGTHTVAHQLRVGSGSGGNGIYNLTGGDLLATRGGTSAVSGHSSSLEIGVAGGIGLLKISGGSLVTRVSAGIGSGGSFCIEGGAADYINIGSSGSGDGYWGQDPGGILDLQFSTNGITPVFIDYVDGSGGSGDVVFASGSLLDVGFVGSLDTFGLWDVMSWEGELTDNGLEFVPGIDTNKWSFGFVDTTGSGEPDTMQVMSVAYSDGTWINATSSSVSWADSSMWSGGTVAFGSDKTALFELDHIVGKNVDLPTDITIGTIRYRDNGSVNRSMVIESVNGSRLVMAATNSTPLIWARNKDIFVDVVIDGTNGLELAATQGTGSVNLKQRNTYSGTTTVLDDAGTIKATHPGNFGSSDLVVQGSVYVDHSQALVPSARLSLETGATMTLDFSNIMPGVTDFADLFVSSLELGGVMQPDGIYSASTHPAYFSGLGEIVVQPVRDGFPLILNETNAIAWPSQAANLYDVCETGNLVSNDWNVVDTVPATVPTNIYAPIPSGQAAGFYKVVERPDYLPTIRAGVVAELDKLITNNYLTNQNLTPGDIRHGQFRNSDNMRMSECTPVLVWCYMQPDSQYFGDTNVLNRAIWSIDHMCRAQGINGGFNEYHGWCGVPDRTNGKSSVVGFTLHALGNAVELMANLPEMQPRLLEYMDPNGTGSNDTKRLVAWKNMLAQAMPFQFSGNGRGHAPNQDLCALMGVYAVNGGYAALNGGTPLKTQAEIDVLSNEIYYGYPSAASSRPNGKWFSETGMLSEHGHGDYGYDGNYGVKVTTRYLGVLAPLDSTTAEFLATKYADALKYFFVVDDAAPLGIFAENGISRRSTGDPLDPTMSIIGCAAGYHPSLDRLYDIMLPHFASAPSANFNFSSPHMFQIGVWGWCEWLDKISEPVNTDYRLPTEQIAAFEFRDDTYKILVTKPENGVPTYYTEIWDTADQARRHVVGREAETIESLHEF